MRKIKTLTAALAVTTAMAVLLAGCSSTSRKVTGKEDSGSGRQAASDKENDNNSGGQSKTVIPSSSVEQLSASDKDKDATYDEADAEKIVLSDNSGQVKINSEGTYLVSGSSSDSQLVIDVGEEEDVHLILRDVNITSKTSAPIYIISADEVYITLEGSNTLANGGSFEAIDENDIDSVIYSKDDLTINGSGSLNITSPAGHGIVCKDDLVITGGSYQIDAKEDGINTNDSILVTSGTFMISVKDDAIHTDGLLQIDGGSYEITAAEGIEGTYVLINDGDITIEASDDGINAGQKSDAYTPTIEINGGSIKITMGQGDTDGIDSNGNLYINGGTVDITGQSPCDYDGEGVINGGKVIINGSEVTELPNQTFGPGGMGGFPSDMNGGPQGGFPGGDNDMQGNFSGDKPDGFPGDMPDGFPGDPPDGFDGNKPADRNGIPDSQSDDVASL
ncbi:MAG: carbohydrate-binding domain-containing protein [Clostridiales bacterium]|nr:carbohydrate-binding domain-containing protein [Clostridiales bacterium]